LHSWLNLKAAAALVAARLLALAGRASAGHFYRPGSLLPG
jgi:hypothetical protein